MLGFWNEKSVGRFWPCSPYPNVLRLSACDPLDLNPSLIYSIVFRKLSAALQGVRRFSCKAANSCLILSGENLVTAREFPIFVFFSGLSFL